MSAQPLADTTPHPVAEPGEPDRRGKLFWTLGNMLMLIGLYLLLYVGGLFADEQYNVMAAQGGSDIPLPEIVAEAPSSRESIRANVPSAPVVASAPAKAPASASARAPGQAAAVVPTAAPKRFVLPQLNNPGGGRELNSAVPATVEGYGPSTVTRIIIPKLFVDRKVVEVGWTYEEQNGQKVAVWEVAKYAVGHHTGSANPSQGGNIVLSGHSGGQAFPFNDLIYLKPGDPIILWSNGQQYQYTVKEHLLLDEVGPKVTQAQRIANARYIEPADEELVTLVSCWPLNGPDKFNQRIVIRAVPNRPAAPAATEAGPEPALAQPTGGWTIR